jgi:mono/diheme cytochrome c family protein
VIHTKRLFMACVSAVALGACGGASSSTETGDGAAQYAGPIGSSDVARGQEVFQSICAGCHSNGPALENLGWDPARVRQQIREGSGRMPPIRDTRVSAEDMEAVLAYLATIGGVVDESGAAPGGSGDEALPAQTSAMPADEQAESEPLEDDL